MPPEGASDDGVQTSHTERFEARRLGADLVSDGHLRETSAPGLAVRSERDGAGTATASTENVDGDDEVLVGVECCAGADDSWPPTRGGLPVASIADDVRITRERVLDEDDVRRVVVQLAPALVGHDDIRQRAATFENDVSQSDGSCLRVEPTRRLHRTRSGRCDVR